MTRKEKIIVTVRDAVYGWLHSSLSLLRIIVLSRRPSKPRFARQLPEEVVILGNGPSLGAFLEESPTFLQGRATVCVNHYAIARQFESVKPDMYIISSPEFFLKDEFEAYADRKQTTLRTIAEKTTWPMVLYVPMFAKGQQRWKEHFKDHEHISIAYFNNTPIEGMLSVNLWAMRRQLGMPRPHNVIIPCIALSIFTGFKKMYLAGVEHSWLKEIVVDEDNEVLVSQKHFYDKQAAKVHKGPALGSPQPMLKGIKMEKRKLHEVLEKFYLSFKSYWEIKPYAEKEGVEIINITMDSYIDAFPKRSISSLMASEKEKGES